MPELLAVYGTLMDGQSFDGRPDVTTLLKPIGPCVIRGRLHDLGRGYPGLVPGEGEVHGELYEVIAPDALQTLDAYEDVEYERRLLDLVEPARTSAWVYVWIGDHAGEPIDEGDWRAFLAIRGER